MTPRTVRSRPNIEPDASTIATWRLRLLRAGYLLIALGMGSQIVPAFFDRAGWGSDESVVNAMLLALVLLSLGGVLYPLRMLPVLFWEMAWKTIWLGSFVLPMAVGPGLDEATAANAAACMVVVIIFAVVPWDYVWRNFVRRSNDRTLAATPV